MSVESYPSDYKNISGIVLPMKTSTSMSGMDVITSYTSVEVDIPIDDSVFSIKQVLYFILQSKKKRQPEILKFQAVSFFYAAGL